MLVPTALRSHFSGSPNRGRRPSGGRGRHVLMASAVVIGTLGGTALLAQPASAAGATFYISPTGSDAAVCSMAAPCATLAHALSIDAASDTIMVDPGTYDVPAGTSDIVPAALAGTVGSPTIIESVGGAGVTAFVSTGGVNGLLVNASHVTVDGLTFNNFGAAGILVTPPSSATPPATVSGETIENDVVNNSDQCAIVPSTTAVRPPSAQETMANRCGSQRDRLHPRGHDHRGWPDRRPSRLRRDGPERRQHHQGQQGRRQLHVRLRHHLGRPQPCMLSRAAPCLSPTRPWAASTTTRRRQHVCGNGATGIGLFNFAVQQHHRGEHLRRKRGARGF